MKVCLILLALILTFTVSISFHGNHQLISVPVVFGAENQVFRPASDILAFPHVGDEILVKFRGNSSPGAMTLAHREINATSVRHFNIVKNLHLVRLPQGISVNAAIEIYKRNPEVVYAEPNYTVKAYELPNDPDFPQLWNLRNVGQNEGTPGADINATQAWDITTGAHEVVIAVIDTGVDYKHPDLAGNMWRNPGECDKDGKDDDRNGHIDDCHGINVAYYTSNPMDDNSHGTHVAGIIGAMGNNAKGITGVNWNISIMACKFLDETGTGTIAGAIACLEYVKEMKDRGENIIATNNSWGGGGFSQALFDAIEAHQESGILFIAAAGNWSLDNDIYPDFPSSYRLPNIISVTATDRRDNLAPYANEGKHTVHLGAPGSEILSTTIGGGYDLLSGTSMAAPHVTGTAALLKAQESTRDWKAIKNLIIAGGYGIPSLENTIHKRRLDAYGSLACSNATLLSRLLPAGKAIHAFPGVPVDLSMLHINCSLPNGEIDVIVDPGGEIVSLHDDGLPPDKVWGDGIYSGQWTFSEPGLFSLTFPDDDTVWVKVLSEEIYSLFRPSVSYPTGFTSPEAVAIGDVNSDGKKDVVVTTSFSGSQPEYNDCIHVFLQDSSGELQPPVRYRVVDQGVNAILSSIDIGDVNNDGRNDVVVLSRNPFYVEQNFIGVFLQDESGSLGPMIKYGTLNSHQLRIRDMNGDGLLDIVSAGSHENVIGVDLFLQNPAGSLDLSFSTTVSFEEVVDAPDLEVADLNGDEVPDIIVLGGFYRSSFDDSRIAVLYQNSDGGFDPAEYHRLRNLGIFASGLAAGDINSDGRDDIVVTFGGNYPLAWIGGLLQDSLGQLSTPVTYASYDCPTAVRIADVDNDGRQDIIVTHSGWDAIEIYFQAPHGFFFPYILYKSHPYFYNHNPRSLAVGDINGDGLQDIAAVGANSGLVVLYADPHPSTPRMASLYIIRGGNGEGRVTSIPAGIDCGTDCEAFFPIGTYVTLYGNASEGSFFAGCRARVVHYNADGSCTVPMNFAWPVQVDFVRRSVRLTLRKSGTGSGTIWANPPRAKCEGIAPCHFDLPSYTIVNLTVTPDSDSEFLHWDSIPRGDCNEFENRCSFSMDTDTEVTAYFKSDFAGLAVNRAGTGKARGLVTSIPAGISCGWDCEEKYRVGEAVTLVATPLHNARFTGWSGDCTGKAPECYLVMTKNRFATANFISTEITLTSPVSGEVLNSGSVYTIQWDMPALATKFKLLYSLDNGANWIPVTREFITENRYNWQIPAPPGNNASCRIKVIGYNASNIKTGTGTSSPFSIEVVRLDSPKGGETLQSGQNFDIRWSTHGTKKPVNSVRLAYTKDGGITWILIDKVPGDPGSFTWIVPSVREPKPKCKVKIFLLDEKGLVVGSDMSDGYFTIQPAQ